MSKDFKLIWVDSGQTKTATGTGYRVITSSGQMVIEFQGYDGPILLTPNSFGGNWAIK